MKVYTYFDNCCETARASSTLDLWKQSWLKHGWTPVILTEEDAKSHPLYEDFRQKLLSLPTVNGPGFDYHAAMRWLAVANLVEEDPILTTEPDVINYGLATDTIILLMFSSLGTSIRLFTSVPAFIIGRPDDFGRFCKAMIEHELMDLDQYQGRPHLSDQDFATRYGEALGLLKFMPSNGLCREVFDPGWDTSMTVHYATPYMASRNLLPKHEHIPNLR